MKLIKTQLQIRAAAFPLAFIVATAIVNISLAWILMGTLPAGYEWPRIAPLLAVWAVVVVILAIIVVAIWKAEQQRHLRALALLHSRLEDYDQATKQFWSGLSHNLRTPLNAVLGYAELLLDESTVQSNSQLQSDLDRIKTAGYELLGLVNDILTVSEVEVENVKLRPQAVNLTAMISDIQLLIATTASRQDTKFIVTQPESPCIIVTDPYRLERILLALLSNAVKSTIGGSIKLNIRHEAEQLHIELQLSAPGTDSAELNTMLQSFTSKDPVMQNSAIGLAPSRTMIHELGGTIEVSKQFDEGITLAIQLPAPGASQDAVCIEQFVSDPAQPLSVLVIDEDLDSADLLSRHLARLGCTVTAANDGAVGKEMAANLAPDLLVMDIEMMSVPGLAVLQHLKFDTRTRHIPVIVC